MASWRRSHVHARDVTSIHTRWFDGNYSTSGRGATQETSLRQRSGERHSNNKAMGEMSGFENRLQSYSSTQLHELLEDDDKLRRMVREMDEVGYEWVSVGQWQLLELS